MKQKHSKVMTIANRMAADGIGRHTAMIKAWILVKMPLVETKVSGVTHGRRQEAIEHLTRYQADQIRITLHRESGNQYDANAVAVIATVEGKGSYCMGYLPSALAALVAPLMDAGKTVNAAYKEVRGLYQPFMNYGLSILVRV